MLKGNVFCIVLLVLVMASYANATIIFESSGKDDPNAEFTYYSKGTATNGSGTDTEDYWYVNTTEKGRFNRDMAAADFTDASGWTFTLRTRSLAANHSNMQDNWWCVRDATDRWDLIAVAGNGGTAVGVRTLTSAYSWSVIDGNSTDVTQWHTYQIVYDPAGDSGNGTASVYIDGTSYATYTRTQVYNASVPASDLEVRGGDCSGVNTGGHENRYSLIRFETGQHPVPEPATMVLLISGGLLCRCFRRRKV